MLASLRDFAQMLRVPLGDADEALRSERAAKVVLSRRSLFQAAGAMAAGTAFSFGAPEKMGYAIAGGMEFKAPYTVPNRASLPDPRGLPDGTLVFVIQEQLFYCSRSIRTGWWISNWWHPIRGGET